MCERLSDSGFQGFGVTEYFWASQRQLRNLFNGARKRSKEAPNGRLDPKGAWHCVATDKVNAEFGRPVLTVTPDVRDTWLGHPIQV